MQNTAKRVWLLLGMGLLAVPLAAAGVAYACTGLATVSTSPGAGAPGAAVKISGKGFVAHDPSDARTSPAVIRLDSMDGPVLGTASPVGGPAGGSFSVEFTVPEVAPGEHVLVVTQNAANGAPAYGTPARQAFTVLAPPPPPPVAAPAAPAAPTTPLGASPVAVQQLPPAVTQTPARSTAANRRAALASALRSCNRRFASRKGRTRAGKRRLASRRAACRRSATRRLS